MQKISRSILSVLIAVLFLCFNCESLDASKYANQTRRYYSFNLQIGCHIRTDFIVID